MAKGSTATRSRPACSARYGAVAIGIQDERRNDQIPHQFYGKTAVAHGAINPHPLTSVLRFFACAIVVRFPGRRLSLTLHIVDQFTDVNKTLTALVSTTHWQSAALTDRGYAIGAYIFNYRASIARLAFVIMLVLNAKHMGRHTDGIIPMDQNSDATVFTGIVQRQGHEETEIGKLWLVHWRHLVAFKEAHLSAQKFPGFCEAVQHQLHFME